MFKDPCIELCTKTSIHLYKITFVLWLMSDASIGLWIHLSRCIWKHPSCWICTHLSTRKRTPPLYVWRCLSKWRWTILPIEKRTYFSILLCIRQTRCIWLHLSSCSRYHVSNYPWLQVTSCFCVYLLSCFRLLFFGFTWTLLPSSRGINKISC